MARDEQSGRPSSRTPRDDRVRADRAVSDRPGAPGARRISVGGQSVPYPTPASATASRVARANRRTDTKPETLLRSTLHREGMRFRKNYLVAENDFRVKIDVAFPKARVAVFVDGCFWHGCPAHQRVPRRNADYWAPKLAANAQRDRRIDDALVGAGWAVIRVWEHEDPAEIAGRLALLVASRRAGPGS